jgi:hypothetical protein
MSLWLVAAVVVQVVGLEVVAAAQGECWLVI